MIANRISALQHGYRARNDFDYCCDRMPSIFSRRIRYRDVVQDLRCLRLVDHHWGQRFRGLAYLNIAYILAQPYHQARFPTIRRYQITYNTGRIVRDVSAYRWAAMELQTPQPV